MALQWFDSMTSGSQLLDDDHRSLIDAANVYVEAVSKRSVDQVHEAFAALFRLTETHFIREEAVQTSLHYRDRENHSRRHRELLEEFKAFHEEMVADARLATIKLHDVESFFQEWIVDHILREDLRMKPYLSSRKW